VRACGVPLDSIELIGSHGQTIFHERGNTLQIGDGSVLAERTGIPVVSDFRPRDIAAGGQGAPLVPYVDYLLYRDKKIGRVSLNIGGIANITAIPAGAAPERVIAFDTGPGNMVVDQLVSIHTQGKSTFDRGGRIASRGK
jgi:Predicted molecular chaperone distantly related to HSP70-fold metalloproteases